MMRVLGQENDVAVIPKAKKYSKIVKVLGNKLIL